MRRALEDTPWSHLPLPLQGLLGEHGWTDSRVLIQELDSREEATSLVATLVTSDSAPTWDCEALVDSLLSWKQTYAGQVERFRKVKLRSYCNDLVGKERQEPKEKLLYTSMSVIGAKAPKSLPSNWSSRRESLLSICDDPKEKQHIEETERLRWLDILAGYLMECSFPVVLEIADHPAPRQLLGKVFGAKRSKTLRRRAKTWATIRDWFMHVFGAPYPASISQLLSFADDYFTADTGKTVPLNIAVTLQFMEKAGGIRAENQLSQHILWKGYIESATASAQVGRTTVKRAPMFTTAMIISLEILVCSPGPRYRRAMAWLRLVKIWAGLRGGDCQGIDPDRLVLGGSQLKGVLTVTKTTGPGKKVLEVGFYVHRHASYSGQDWLAIGLSIWQSEDFAFSRDFFVPRCGPGEDLPVRKMASACFMSGYNHHLLLCLFEPRRSGSGWGATGERLIVSPGHLHWKEHSERHYLPTVAAAADVPKEKRDYTGRWGLGRHQSDEYILSSQQIVREVQVAVLRFVSHGDPGFDETEVLDGYRTALIAAGVGEWTAYESMERHQVLHLGDTGNSLHQSWPLDLSIPMPDDDFTEVAKARKMWDEMDKQSLLEAQEPPYWVSISQKKGLRKLHRTEVCSAIKWLCRNYEEVENIDTAREDSRCLKCFPQRRRTEEDNSSGGGSTVSSSDPEPPFVDPETLVA